MTPLSILARREFDTTITEKHTENPLFEKFPYLKLMLNRIPQFEGDVEVNYIDVGIANSVFKINNKSSGRIFALKVFRIDLDRAAKTYELFETLRPTFLSQKISTPETVVFPCLCGENVLMVNTFLPGSPITDQDLNEVAGVMGRLHNIAVTAPQKPRYDVPSIMKECSDWKFYPELRKIWDSLDFDYTSQLPKGIIHGDFSYTNLLKDGKEISILDWDKLRYDYLLDDICLAQIYYGIDENGTFKKQTFENFIKDYQTERRLTHIEKGNLVDHLRRCLIEIAFIMHYHTYILLRPSKVVGNPDTIEKIKSNPQNRNIDPDHIATGILSLESMKDDVLRQYSWRKDYKQ